MRMPRRYPRMRRGGGSRRLGAAAGRREGRRRAAAGEYSILGRGVGQEGKQAGSGKSMRLGSRTRGACSLLVPAGGRWDGRRAGDACRLPPRHLAFYLCPLTCNLPGLRLYTYSLTISGGWRGTGSDAADLLFVRSPHRA